MGTPVGPGFSDGGPSTGWEDGATRLGRTICGAGAATEPAAPAGPAGIVGLGAAARLGGSVATAARPGVAGRTGMSANTSSGLFDATDRSTAGTAARRTIRLSASE